MSIEEKIEYLYAKDQIIEKIYLFARALDRKDGDLMKDMYWEDAIEEHQDPIYPDKFHYNGNAHEFVTMAMKGFESLKLTQHRIANPIVKIEGNKALAEAYVYAYHVEEENNKDIEGILFGRHEFKFEKRNDEWKIIYRATIFDSNQKQEGSAFWGEDYDDKLKGKRDKTDLSYEFIF